MADAAVVHRANVQQLLGVLSLEDVVRAYKALD